MDTWIILILLTGLDVSRGQLSSVVKMNTDEFTLGGKCVFTCIFGIRSNFIYECKQVV